MVPTATTKDRIHRQPHPRLQKIQRYASNRDNVLTQSRNPWVSAIGPVSLIGGTAAVYASVLRHPSSTLTPLSLFYMMLLALQYTLQPRLSRKYIPKESNKKTVAFAEEVVKTGMAAAVLAMKPSRHHSDNDIWKDWSLSSSLTVAGLPAVLYAAQGVLQYTAHQYLDPVTFNGLTQTKTLSAALCCFLVMGKPQSPAQMVALVLLLVSALMFQERRQPQQGSSSLLGFFGGRGGKNNNYDQTTTMVQRDEEWFVKGVVPCLGATFLSGLAGALSQKGLQLTGGTGRDPFLYTVEISVFSALTLIIDMWRDQQQRNKNAPKGQQQSWTAQTWIPIVFKAAGGVLTALVHKYAGSVAKGFALLVGLVLSGLVQSVLSQEEILPNQTAATLLCLLSGWMHFTNPPLH